jgi:hypothetical protein
MNSLRTPLGRAAAAAVLAAALAGCTSGAAPTTTPAPTTAPTTSAAPAGDGAVGPAEQTVAAALTTYQRAVAGGDFVLACSQMTAEAAGQLVAAVQRIAPAPSCVEAMTAVLGQTGAAEAAVEAANTITVTDVEIDDLSATVRWTSTRQGVLREDALGLQQVDQQWRLAGPA